MKKVLWVIGAGASKHLGMPLLAEFRSFFREMWWRFPENRTNARLQDVVPCAIGIMDAYPDYNIEQLLLPTSPLTEENRDTLKKATCRTFERRQLGRIAKLIPSHTSSLPHKLEAYARLLCCMEDGDVIVTFNYDNAFEYVLGCIAGVFDLLNIAELSSAQLTFLKNRGRDRWIPRECHDLLKSKCLCYAPATSFAVNSPRFGCGPSTITMLKVHGSINWFLSTGERIHVGEPLTGDQDVPILAYPEPSKSETSRPPLGNVMSAGVSALNQFDRIVVIGYSLPQSDSIGHPFVQRLVSRLGGMRALAIDPYPSAALLSTLKHAASHTVVPECFEKAFMSDKFNGLDLQSYMPRFREE